MEGDSRLPPTLYIPYQLYTVGSRVVGCDSHFWPLVKSELHKVLMVRPRPRLLEGPGREGAVLEPRIPVAAHREWLEWASSLEARPLHVGVEDLAYASMGVEPPGRGEALAEALRGLSRILLPRGGVRPLGVYAWLRLSMPGCVPADPAYRLLARLEPGLGEALNEACRRAMGYMVGRGYG